MRIFGILNITADSFSDGGRYLDAAHNPARGLMVARMIGHVTYLSDDGLRDKFGREIKSGDIATANDVQFQVESYLHHQGRSFSQYFDANTYLLMTRALDQFDPARDFGDDLVAALRTAQSDFLVVAFTSDWRFSPARSKEIVDALIAARRNVVSAVDLGTGAIVATLPLTQKLAGLTMRADGTRLYVVGTARR